MDIDTDCFTLDRRRANTQKRKALIGPGRGFAEEALCAPRAINES
jgi:hypothetical protein